MINAVLRLRRDNDYNYEKIKNSFIPENGEICLVDTSRNGLCAVCGDGVTPFGQLKFINEIVKKGYYYNGSFYRDLEHKEEYSKDELSFYIDKNTSLLYQYTGEAFSAITEKIPTASAEVSGIVKLYTNLGNNVDGTITQKALTEALSKKIELILKEDDELVVFTN